MFDKVFQGQQPSKPTPVEELRAYFQEEKDIHKTATKEDLGIFHFSGRSKDRSKMWSYLKSNPNVLPTLEKILNDGRVPVNFCLRVGGKINAVPEKAEYYGVDRVNFFMPFDHSSEDPHGLRLHEGLNYLAQWITDVPSDKKHNYGATIPSIAVKAAKSASALKFPLKPELILNETKINDDMSFAPVEAINNINQQDGKLETSSPFSDWRAQEHINFSFTLPSPGAEPVQYRIIDFTEGPATESKHTGFLRLLKDAEKGPVMVRNFGFQKGVFSAERLNHPLKLQLMNESQIDDDMRSVPAKPIKYITQQDGQLETSSPFSDWIANQHIDFSFTPPSLGAKPVQYRITDYTQGAAEDDNHREFLRTLKDAEKGPVTVRNFGFQNGVFSAYRLEQENSIDPNQATSSELRHQEATQLRQTGTQEPKKVPGLDKLLRRLRYPAKSSESHDR